MISEDIDEREHIEVKSLTNPKKRQLSEEEKLFLGEIVAEETNDIPPPNKPAGYIDKQSIPYTQTHANKPREEDGDIIIIKDQKKRVEISYSHEQNGKTLTFSVCVPAASIEVQKDGVSILISKDIEIRPPSLIPCKLKTNNKEYSVIFAGATHTIGKYINIPFIIVE